jgi:hypothetical protein
MSENEYISKDVVEEQKVVEEKKKKKSSKSSSKSVRSNPLVQILNGEFLTKEFVLNNLTFIFFIIFLLLLLVGKGYYGKQLSKDAENAQTELDEMSANYVEVKAKLEEETRRSKLRERLELRGLHETVNPTKVIRIKKEE